MTPAQFQAARQSLGLSQARLAKALGVHTLTVSKWERGVNPIPRVVELALAALQPTS